MKKLISVFLCLALLFSVTTVAFAEGESEAAATYWDGTTFTQPVDSDEDGVYEIGTAAELAWVAQNGSSSKYILTADIYVNDLLVSGDTLTKLDGSEVDTDALAVWPIGNKTFSGTLDGNGYTVSGLYNATTPEAASTNDGRGLFSRGKNATVKNLRLSNVYFANGTYMGGVFGYANDGTMLTVDNCYVENVTVTTALASAGQCYPAVGGLVGYTQTSGLTVNNTAVVNASITGSRDGSILGDAWAAGENTVTNTYIVSSREPYGNGTSGTGNFKGTVTVSNFYSTTATTGTVAPQSKQINESGFISGAPLFYAYDLGENFYTTEKYPMQKIFIGEITADNKQLGTAPFEGKGTEEDPYIITDADGLRIAVGVYGAGFHYELANDIYLNEIDKINWKTGEVAEGYVPNEWFVTTDLSGYYFNGFSGSGRFSGTVDGKGYSVHGIYYNKESLSTVTGLFPAAKNTTIKNLAIENSFITGARLNGGFVGYGAENILVDTCLVKDTVSIVGYNGGNAYITEQYIDAETGKGKSPFNKNVVAEGGASYESIATGGIIGYADKIETVKNCAVYGDVRSITAAERFSTTNPLTNGGNPVVVSNGSHLCGLIGTGWNSTITMTGNISLLHPHDALSGSEGSFTTTCENNYALSQYTYNGVTQTCCNVVTEEAMTGAKALTNMPGLAPEIWTATAGYPVQTIFADEEVDDTIKGDVNGDKVLDDADMADLRKKLIGAEHTMVAYAGDVNEDEAIDILDLVTLYNLIIALA